MMRTTNLGRWLLAALLLFPLAVAAQQPDSQEQPQAPAGRAERSDEACQKARENFQQARQELEQTRQAYREAVKQYGRDSEEACAASRRLHRAEHQLQAARHRVQHCRRDSRTVDSETQGRRKDDD
ncbi:MAG: hypothetical protein HYY26_03680, partial [Acidobacteria bacterium]|nr:hypothetical protein [Acidobacteriota bacterium]